MKPDRKATLNQHNLINCKSLIFQNKISFSFSRRSLSLPNIEHEMDLNYVQLPFSVAKLLKHTFKSCVEGNGFGLLKNQTEELRNEYMQEGQQYHERLKMLGLADRLPGKIYDDLHSIMKGLSVENQVYFTI